MVKVTTSLVGRDPFNQNFRKFRSKTQWIGSVQPEKFRKNGSTFWGGPLFPVGPVGILVEWIAPDVLACLPGEIVFARGRHYRGMRREISKRLPPNLHTSSLHLSQNLARANNPTG